MPREREIVKRVRNLCNHAGAKLIKTSGEGEPDLVGVYKGFAVAIECKQPGEKPTHLQHYRLSEWKDRGAIAFWTDFPPKALQTMQRQYEEKVKELAQSTVFIEYREEDESCQQ